jgi:toxin ParE1/3/4
MAHRLAPQARAELRSIWNYIFKESGNAVVADNVIDAITERFYLLSQYPRMGRTRDDLRPGLRSFPVGQYVIIYTIEDEDVEILHVFHGRQDIDWPIDAPMKRSGTRIFAAVIALLRAKFELFPAKSATGLIAGLAATCIPSPRSHESRLIAPFPPD